MHKNTISGLFPSLLAEEGRVSLVVCGVTQSVPFIYMHNIHKPCPDMIIIIIIKKGKEKEEKNKYDTNTSLPATVLPSYFVIEKPCCARHSTSARIFFFLEWGVRGYNIAFPPPPAAPIRWPSANQYGVIIYEKQTSARMTCTSYIPHMSVNSH